MLLLTIYVVGLRVDGEANQFRKKSILDRPCRSLKYCLSHNLPIRSDIVRRFERPLFQIHNCIWGAPQKQALLDIAVTIIIHHQTTKHCASIEAKNIEFFEARGCPTQGQNISRIHLCLACIFAKKVMKSEAVKVDVKHTLQIIRGDSASSDDFSSSSDSFGSKKVNKVRYQGPMR